MFYLPIFANYKNFIFYFQILFKTENLANNI